jgi:hypothetical protein
MIGGGKALLKRLDHPLRGAADTAELGLNFGKADAATTRRHHCQLEEIDGLRK